MAAGVYRIPLPLPNDGLRAVNVYAIVGDDGLVVIDSGWSITEGREALAAGLDILGYRLGDVSQFLVTHIHRDHYTQAIALRRDFGMKVGLGEGERVNLAEAMNSDGNEMAPTMRQLHSLGADHLVDELVFAAEFPIDDVWELPDQWLVDQQMIQANDRLLKVVSTPGHTHGHVVFHDAAGELLFAGDHVLPTITPSIGFEGDIQLNPLGDYLGSLAAVRALPDALLLPAHGAVGPSVHARVDELLDHHGARLRATGAAVRNGGHNAYAVASQLVWTNHGRRFDELNVFNKMLAVAETHAHLQLLVARGELAESVEDGVHLYS